MSKLTPLISHLPQPRWALIASTAALAALAACNQPGNTPGQKVDNAIATTEKAVENAAAKTEKAAETVAAKTEKAADTVAAKAEQAGAEIKEGAAKAVDATADAAMTAAVKAALIAAPDLSALMINVDTKDSVVTLNGTVKSDAQKTQAVTVAEKVKGVKSVVNKLAVGS